MQLQFHNNIELRELDLASCRCCFVLVWFFFIIISNNIDNRNSFFLLGRWIFSYFSPI